MKASLCASASAFRAASLARRASRCASWRERPICLSTSSLDLEFGLEKEKVVEVERLGG